MRTLSVDDINYEAIAWRQPSRTSAHPFILANPRHSAHPPTSVYSTSPSRPPPPVDAEEEPTHPSVEVELFIHTDKSVDSLFIRTVDAETLELEVVGEADTCYGHVRRFSAVTVRALSHIILVSDVYELPSAFAGTKFEEGVIGIPLVWSLGATVLFDRGWVYLLQPDMVLPAPAEWFQDTPPGHAPLSRSGSPASRKSTEVGPFDLDDDFEDEDRVLQTTIVH
ncbi:hypothetical protein HDU96_002859 [Phlyctochytrium bullatum]|nr:hypothetical protein HDU96_002859 [Phlyctochytrium bullatum]